MQIMTAERLDQLKRAQEFPVDVDLSKTQFLHVGKIGMTLIRLTQKGETVKHLNYWQEMTAEEINERFAGMKWEKSPEY